MTQRKPRTDLSPIAADAFRLDGRAYPSGAPLDPCYCTGPFTDLDPADRPESALGREHDRGSVDCDYWRPVR